MKVVGIVCKHKEVNNLINNEVNRALIDVGLATIGILPPNENIRYDSYPCEDHVPPQEWDFLEKQLRLVDGIVFQGGQEIGDFEYDIARFAFSNDIPTLGFCAGQSTMAASLGAEIVVVDPNIHKTLQERYAHYCDIVPGTLFATIIKDSRIEVNSRHIRAVKRCDGMIVSAIDPDGNAEVLEAPDKHFYLGVRFHPESLYKTDIHMQSVFKAFAHAVNNKDRS